MSEQPPEQDVGYDPDLDDPDDDTTGYENDADAQGDEAEPEEDE